MRHAITVACLLSSALVPVQAQININTDAVKKAVVFLYAAKESGEVDPDKAIGTGFFVEVPLKSQPQKAYKLLVTARHMIEPQWALCPNPNPKRLYIRLNKKDYSAATDAEGVGYVPLTVAQDNQPSWMVHDDPQVDVAITILNPKSFESYDTSAVPLSVFATPEELHGLNVGTFVISAGLIPGASGKNRNYPIFKFGYVSSIPDEPIDTSCAPGGQTQPRKVWLVAANLVPGNSGSPIFVVPAGANGILIGGGRAMLVGLQSISLVLADISGMTQAEYIFDVVKKLNLNDADLYRGANDKKPK